MRMICSRDECVVKHLETLRSKFIERGYPCHLVENNLDRGARIPRADLLKPKPVYPQQAWSGGESELYSLWISEAKASRV